MSGDPLVWHSERAVLAAEGTRSELYYFWPHYGFVEFGEPDEDGLCEVIGTTFDNLAMPLVRYRTGDYVRLAKPDAEREFAWPAVEEIAGRGQEFLVTASGRRISLTAFNMHDAILTAVRCAVFSGRTGRGRVPLHPLGAVSFSRLAGIESGVMHKLGDDFRLVMREVDEVEKTPRGKHTWLVSKL